MNVKTVMLSILKPFFRLALIMLVVLLVLPRGICGTIHHRAVSRRRARRAHTHVEPNEPAASALQSGYLDRADSGVKPCHRYPRV